MPFPFRNKHRPLTIAQILRGCEAGRIQSVGLMQVIPLVSDAQDERIQPPVDAIVSTESYGELLFHNPSAALILVPSHATYVVEQAAQDHAMPSAAFVRARKSRRYDRAMCVQRGQGGLVRKGNHEMAILPLPLRRPALQMRKKSDYSRLWGSIETFNRAAGTKGGGDLVRFLKHYRRQLDQFVAEFELVPRQVGAIILVGGEVVGVERAPSWAYWAAVWEPLIRNCYGAYAIVAEREDPDLPPGRVPLDAGRARTLGDLERALDEADVAEDEFARRTVRELLDKPFEIESEEALHELQLETVRNAQLTGQVVREDERVLYASLIADGDVMRPRGWRWMRPFRL
ncbi:MAG: ARPP-1 family domain-containing protein [Planctomycetota bacterium]|jgi:hypothetical protein